MKFGSRLASTAIIPICPQAERKITNFFYTALTVPCPHRIATDEKGITGMKCLSLSPPS